MKWTLLKICLFLMVVQETPQEAIRGLLGPWHHLTTPQASTPRVVFASAAVHAEESSVVDKESVENGTWNKIYPTHTTKWNLLPNVTDTSIVSFNGYYYVIGGANASYVYSSVWKSNNTKGDEWQLVRSSAPFGHRMKHFTITTSEYIYVIGGRECNRTHPRPNVTECPIQDDVWTSGNGGLNWTSRTDSAGWGPRLGFQVVEFRNDLVLMGGFRPESSKFLSDIWTSDDNGQTWKEKSSKSPWAPRKDFAAMVSDSQVYVMGGNSSGQLLNDIHNSTNLESWHEITNKRSKWSPRASMGYTVSGSNMWIVGGRSYNGTLDDIWRSSTNGSDWIFVQNSTLWPGYALVGVTLSEKQLPLVFTTTPNNTDQARLSNTSQIFNGTLNLLCEYNNSVCGGHGNCTIDNRLHPVCDCILGWVGVNCTTRDCNPQTCRNGECKNNGTLPRKCVCKRGWQGHECDKPICDVPCVRGCCIAPDECKCDDNWFGKGCNIHKSTLWRIGHYISTHGKAWFTSIGCIISVGLVTYGIVLNQFLRNPTSAWKRKKRRQERIGFWEGGNEYGSILD